MLPKTNSYPKSEPSSGWRGVLGFGLIYLFAFLVGCGTTTQRLATEQLLMSDAVDQAISKIQFDSLKGEKVYLDTTYVQPIRGLGFVNADYIISSLRQQLTAARCLVQDDRDSADIIVEPRVGALGTDAHEVTYGVPSNSAIASTAAAFSSTPIPAVPEISFGRSDAHSGIAKILVFAFEKETKEPVWQSGVAKFESNSNNTWVLGAGPFQRGSIYDDLRFAGKRLKRRRFGSNYQQLSSQPPVPTPNSPTLRYDAPFVFEQQQPKLDETESIADTGDPASDSEEAESSSVAQTLQPVDTAKVQEDSQVQQASHDEK